MIKNCFPVWLVPVVKFRLAVNDFLLFFLSFSSEGHHPGHWVDAAGGMFRREPNLVAEHRRHQRNPPGAMTSWRRNVCVKNVWYWQRWLPPSWPLLHPCGEGARTAIGSLPLPVCLGAILDCTSPTPQIHHNAWRRNGRVLGMEWPSLPPL